MKKLFAAFALVATLFVQAQNLEFGAKAGWSYLTSSTEIPTSASQVIEGSGAAGWHAGLFLHARLAGIYLQPELRYLNYKEDFTDGQEITTNRLDLPVFIGFKTAKILRFQAGPVISYYLDDNFSFNDLDNFDPNDLTVGLQIGAGLSISKLRADIGYEFGLSQRSIDYVSDLTGTSTRLSADTRPSLFHLTIGLAF